jgi:hypothetical protein
MDGVILFAATFAPVVTFVGSFVAIWISIKNSAQSKRQVIVGAFVNSRMEHIKDMRQYLQDFLDEYIANSNSNTTKLRVIKARIDLAIINDYDVYSDILQDLDKCISTPYTHKQASILIKDVQHVISEIWRKVNSETEIMMKSQGIIKKTNNAIVKFTMDNIIDNIPIKKQKKAKKKAKKTAKKTAKKNKKAS